MFPILLPSRMLARSLQRGGYRSYSSLLNNPPTLGRSLLRGGCRSYTSLLNNPPRVLGIPIYRSVNLTNSLRLQGLIGTCCRERFIHGDARPQDYYSELGVNRDASDSEIRKAYYELAKKFHPDKNTADKDAVRKFREIQEAYEVLRDREERSHYDQAGHADFKRAREGGGCDGSGFGIPFDDFFQVPLHERIGMVLLALDGLIKLIDLSLRFLLFIWEMLEQLK